MNRWSKIIFPREAEITSYKPTSRKEDKKKWSNNVIFRHQRLRSLCRFDNNKNNSGFDSLVSMKNIHILIFNA